MNINYLNNKYSYQDLLSIIHLDEIMEVDLIPPRIINQLNSLLNSKYSKTEEEAPIFLTYDCEIPANDIYENIWNTRTPNSYPANFRNNDTLVKIKLVNSPDEFHKPGEGWVTSRFGWRNNGWHNGIDMGIYHWEPIYSVFNGVVRVARFYGGFGRLVVIRHDNGLESYYAHMSSIRVKPGQRVKAGDIVGTSGNSGRSNGTHLHFELRYKGKPVNPMHIICFRENKLLHEEIILKKHPRNYFVYTVDAIIYEVRRGDYLHKIAQEFGTTINRICEINGISRNSTLRVGQKLRIFM